MISRFLVIVWLGVSPAWATIRFELPTVYAPLPLSGSATGYVDVVVRADAADLSRSVSSFNVAFVASGGGVSFQSATAHPSPLLLGAMPTNFSQSISTVRAAEDVYDRTPSSYQLADNRGLVRAAFTISAGSYGSHPLTFLAGNELAGPSGQVLPLGTGVQGVISAFLPGDFNRDGVVNTADYTVWRDAYGTAVAKYAGADGDGDAAIGAGDLPVWKAGYGSQISASLAVAVPEPAGWLSPAAFIVACARVRLRRRA